MCLMLLKLAFPRSAYPDKPFTLAALMQPVSYCSFILVVSYPMAPHRKSLRAHLAIYGRGLTHILLTCVNSCLAPRLKVPWSALKLAALFYLATSFQLKPEERAGHIEKPRLLFKMANGVLFISARARALHKLGKAAFDNHSLIDYTIESILNSMIKIMIIIMLRLCSFKSV